LLEVLQLPEAEGNAIIDQLGFGQKATLFPLNRFPTYFFTSEELEDHVETVTWPEFVLNNFAEVVAANKAAQALWGVDFHAERQKRLPSQMNLLSIASERQFAERVINWDECVATLVASIKGNPLGDVSLENPSPYLTQVLDEFMKHNQSYLPRLLNIWGRTSIREPKVRWSYRIVWRDPEHGEMRFNSIISTASEPDALQFNDWIPLDAETWLALDSVKGRARV